MLYSVWRKLFFHFTLYIFLFPAFNLSHSAEQITEINGRVIDKISGKGLAKANVELVLSKIGTTTKKNGEFLLECILTDTDTLHITYIGYKPVKKHIHPDGAFSKLNILLEPTILSMPEVSVYGDHFASETKTFALDPSARRLKQYNIKTTPAIGSPDIFRALQTVPGVSFTNEASSQFNVRGGNPDQNLVLLDGAVVYYPFHVFGLSSMFNVDYVDNMFFSLGGFSAQYGDRLSSVLSMQSKNPQKKFPHRINMNIIGADITTGGKLGKKFGWVYSGKSSFLKLPNSITFFDFPYDYYDSTLKLEFTPSENHTFEIMSLRTNDELYIEDKWERKLHSSNDTDKLAYIFIDRDKLRWRNKVLSSRWKSQMSQNANVILQYYTSEYSNSALQKNFLDFPDNIDEKFIEDKERVILNVTQDNDTSSTAVNNSFMDKTWKGSFNWDVSPKIGLRAGVQNSQFSTNYFWDGMYQFMEEEFVLYYDFASAEQFLYKKNFSCRSAFSELEFEISSHLKARTGLRLSKWNRSTHIFLDPRLNLQYKKQNLAVNLAYGKYTQGLTTMLEEGLIGFLELYFPAIKNDRIETAHHFISNIKYDMFSILDISLSGYYKKFENLAKSIGPGPATGQTPGKAYGVEFELSGNFWGFDSKGSYVWAHSNRTFKNITYDSNFDTRHRVQFFTNKKLGENFNISVYWDFHTGQPYDPKIYRALLPDYEIAIPLENGIFEWYDSYEMDVVRGRIRYPLYHRLDVNIMRSIKTKKFTFAPYLSIRNVYHRLNPLFYKSIEFQMEAVDGDFVNPHIERDAFVIGILPTVGVRIGF